MILIPTFLLRYPDIFSDRHSTHAHRHVVHNPGALTNTSAAGKVEKLDGKADFKSDSKLADFKSTDAQSTVQSKGDGQQHNNNNIHHDNNNNISHDPCRAKRCFGIPATSFTKMVLDRDARNQALNLVFEAGAAPWLAHWSKSWLHPRGADKAGGYSI